MFSQMPYAFFPLGKEQADNDPPYCYRIAWPENTFRKSSGSLSLIFVRKSADLDSQYKEDVDELERVQQIVTKMIIGLESVTCRERLKELCLLSPEKKRFSESNSSLNVLKRLLILPRCMAGK